MDDFGSFSPFQFNGYLYQHLVFQYMVRRRVSKPGPIGPAQGARLIKKGGDCIDSAFQGIGREINGY
jgi:hypothetical protein